MQVLLLINETSGGVARLGPEAIADLAVERLGHDGHQLQVLIGDAVSLIERATAARNQVDLVISAGGDGTVAAIAGAIRHSRTALLPLPCGTLNLLCRDLDIQMDVATALDQGLSGEVWDIDVGLVNDRVFLNNIVVGAYARLAEAREDVRSASSLPELAAALGSAADAMFHAEPVTFRIELDGETFESHTNTIGIFNNAVTGSQFLIPQRAGLSEGELVVYATNARDGLGFAAVLAAFAGGNPEASADIEQRVGRACRISCNQAFSYAVDGDPLQAETGLTLSIDPRALKVMAPRNQSVSLPVDPENGAA